jgi:hypothetical protein
VWRHYAGSLTYIITSHCELYSAVTRLYCARTDMLLPEHYSNFVHSKEEQKKLPWGGSKQPSTMRDWNGLNAARWKRRGRQSSPSAGVRGGKRGGSGPPLPTIPACALRLQRRMLGWEEQRHTVVLEPVLLPPANSSIVPPLHQNPLWPCINTSWWILFGCEWLLYPYAGSVGFQAHCRRVS